MATAKLEWGQSVQGIKLSVSSDRPRYAPGEPIDLAILMRNEGPQPISYAQTTVWDDFELQVQSDGREVEQTRFGRDMTAARGADARTLESLPPGKQATWEIRISLYFDMTTSQRYAIAAARSFFDPKTKAPVRVRSNTLSIEVGED